MSRKHSANDQRSNAKNPNNAAYAADRANRQAQASQPHPVNPPAADETTPQERESELEK